MKKDLIKFLLILLMIVSTSNLLCGEEEIEHCLQCGTGVKSETCVLCEDKYFLFMNNVLCLPCDNPLYGSYGCGGKCDENNWITTRNVLCEKTGCKEGYYNLEGFCLKCSVGSDNCAKCTYEPPSGTNSNSTLENYFTCQACINNQYKIENDGRCNKCYIFHCQHCHYDENENSVCDRCYGGYYVNSAKKCSLCHWPVYIAGGICEVCSSDITDYKNANCFCYQNYTPDKLLGCRKCPTNCEHCHIDENTDKAICYRCNVGYTLNSQGECVSCGDNCGYCYFDNKQNIICTACRPGYNMNEERNCLICPDNCRSCKKISNGSLQCTSCFDYYGLNSQSQCVHCPDNCINCFWKSSTGRFGCSYCRYDNYYSYSGNYIVGKDDQCVRCQDIQEIGGQGCIKCYLDRYNTQDYRCSRCLGDTRYTWERAVDNVKNYAFVYNTYQCLSNINKDPNYLNGCLEARYDSISNKYLCFICKPEYIPIINDRSCILPEEAGLSSNCKEAINIKTEQNPKYSCLSCKYNYLNIYVEVTNHLGIMDCENQINELYNCIEATKDENGKKQCIRCKSDFQFIDSDEYQQKICDSQCEPLSFYKINWCRKCDDKYYGNPGCEYEFGCEYNSANDELKCNKCKEGYFEFTSGQCFSCSLESLPCTKCHFNEVDPKGYECDECIEGYQINSQTKKCEIIPCEEHSEVTPGCIICQDKLNEYKQQNKCQACKQGFFKTKDGSCVYCKSRQNGGPACEICEYSKDEDGNETNDIRCKYCPSQNLLSSDGKCYNCQEELGETCSNCSFVVNETDNTEILKCDKCKEQYHLTDNGYCIHYQSYTHYIPNCIYPYYHVISDNDDISNENSTENINSNNFTIETICEECKEGYHNFNGTCQKLNIEDCTYLSIINSGNGNKFYECRGMCSKKNYVNINYYYENSTNYTNVSISVTSDSTNSSDSEEGSITNIKNNSKIKLDIESLIYKSYGIKNNTLDLLSDDIKSLVLKAYSCLGNLGTGEEYQPESLKKCKSAKYIEENDTFSCIECLSGYSINEETNTCIQSIKIEMNDKPGLSNCYVENIGTDSSPIYSCKFCKKRGDILIKTESGAKFCQTPYKVDYGYEYEYEEDYYKLEGCTEANANTKYLNNIYNCTNCSYGYIPYYSRYFKRKICQDIFGDILRENDKFDSSIFDDVENVTAVNGICENNKLFTPDGQHCFACNSREVGMVGCKRTCTFSTKRRNVLECEEEGCKSGYLEKSKGLCEPCESVNKGCIECHYENDYLSGYLGLKRERRFVCDQCDDGYIRSEDGTCHNCSVIGLSNCEKCKRDESKDNDLVCYECFEGYFVDNNNDCIKCYESQVRSKDNTCIYCNDVEEGGIEGCSVCENEGGKILCIECQNGFILLENNKTCLKISENINLESITNCQEVALNDNKFYCSKCNKNYILLKENNNDIKCVSEQFISTTNSALNSFCQESINIGTENKPIYTCTKCNEAEYSYYYYNSYVPGDYYSQEEYEMRCEEKCWREYKGDYYKKCFGDCLAKKESYSEIFWKYFTKINYVDNNTAFCNYSSSYEMLENCTEATMKIDEGVINFNCTKCIEDNILKYNADINSYYCKYKYYEKKCVVKYCKKCRADNNYFCESCLPTNYEPNPVTGTCMKKTEKVPAVTFKDIFRLKMNQEDKINGRDIYGPSLMLRGLTNSQINTGHAFLIYMIFKIQYTRNNRVLEEDKKYPTICQILDSVDETDDEANMVEFKCMVNGTEEDNEELSKSKLNNIEDEENGNSGVLGNSNLNDLVAETDIENLDKKEKPSYTVANFLKTVTFSINKEDLHEQNSNDYKYDFTINGKLNKELSPMSFEAQLALAEVKDKKADCIFNVKENKTADLNCKVNLAEYKGQFDTFSFKVAEIGPDENPIYLAKINEILLTHQEKKKKNYTVLIVCLVIAFVLVSGGAVGLIIYCIKKKKKSLNAQNNKEKNSEANNVKEIQNDILDSEKRIQFNNA